MMSKIQRYSTTIWYIILHILIAVYSTTGIFSKLASAEAFLSIKFCLFYGAVIAVLGIYAILWQQILKHFSLTTAFCNKAVTIIWGMIWGAMLFNETIKWNMILGAVVVMIGVVLVVKADE